MANAAVYYDEVRFNVRKEDETEVFIFCRFEGDSPLRTGWRKKSYPASLSTVEIHNMLFKTSEDSPLYWEEGGPSGDYYDDLIDDLMVTIDEQQQAIANLIALGASAPTASE